MRISKSQQDKNQRQLLAAAVELIVSQGYERTTMKQIARAAGLGDATIYKYFPSKEKLVLGYYELAVREALAQTLKTKGLADYGLQERLQRLVDAVLERLLPDREFVAITRGLARDNPLLLLGDALPGKAALKAQFEAWLAEAEAAGQIAACGFKGLLAGLMADYVFAIVVYWLQDESAEFSDTTQLTDLSLGLLVLMLESGLINKLGELGGFLLRNQLARLLQGGGALELLSLARRGLGAAREARP
jgi:AcrR family transcriptional regulator